MNRRRFLLCSAGLGLASLLPLPVRAGAATVEAGPMVTRFGNRLMERLPKDRNVFFSPYSIAMALAMTGAGAAGKTEAEFHKLLGFTSRAEMLQGVSELRLGASSDYELASANSLWLDDSLKLKADYQRLVEQKFQAQLRQVDFDGDPTGSADRVNRWASEQTRGKIRKVLKPNPALRALLANAIYFKGTWKTEFDARQTRLRPFHLHPGGSVEVSMMQRGGSIAYAQTSGLEAVRLPYKGEEVAMVVALPRRPQELFSLQKQDWLSGLGFGRRQVRLALPKFRLETSYSLRPHLQALGLASAFGNQADFRRISTEALKIDKVEHKAFVEVDEQGTEAAAVTTVGMTRATSVAPPPIVFTADRPFLFAIQHLPTRSAIFSGRVMNPA